MINQKAFDEVTLTDETAVSTKTLSQTVCVGLISYSKPPSTKLLLIAMMTRFREGLLKHANEFPKKWTEQNELGLNKVLHEISL